jgi:hypothetical protein
MSTGYSEDTLVQVTIADYLEWNLNWKSVHTLDVETK